MNFSPGSMPTASRPSGVLRTPGVLRGEAGQRAVGIEAGERFVGLIHLGVPVQEQRPPERDPVGTVATYLD